uniref:ceramide glucosyltransferase n=1 Tax=Ciona savignyi TaxID=51511 RepID=H2YPF3_CIOSA
WVSMVYFLEGFAAFGIGLDVWLFLMHLLAIVYSKLYMNKKPPELMKAEVRGVSILKPLKGVDTNLEDNLETFFEIDYPQFEILFCIQDANDPAIDVVQRLISKYPGVDAKIVSGGKRIGVNPKINNLMPGYNIMKYNLFWICDSGIRVLPLTLRDLVSKMKDKVALVHAVPYTSNRKGFASSIEKVNLSCFDTDSLNRPLCITMPTVFVGQLKSLMLKDIKSTCSYHVNSVFIPSGYKLTLSSHPALQNSGNYGVGKFIERMTRWTKLRVAMVPFAVILEPFSECFLSGLLFSWSCLHFFKWNMLVVFLYHVLAWFILDYILFRQLENGHLLMTKCDFLVAWFVRETLTPYIIFSALWDPTINWRTGKYRLRCGGKA